MNKYTKLVIFLFFITSLIANGQDGYTFTMKKDLACTPVKNQSLIVNLLVFLGNFNV